MSERRRVGAVAYLNTGTLVYGLEQGTAGGDIELSYAVPAALADQMGADQLDIGLLPIAALVDQPQLEIVPGLGIVTRGASLSVLLISHCSAERIQTLGWDPESRTSNLLANLLLGRLFNCRPRCELATGNLSESLERYDAVIQIGDKALFDPIPKGLFVYDLAELWTTATSRPFVFAAWITKPGRLDRPTYRALHRSLRQGREALSQVAANYTYRGARYPEIAENYLRHHIYHRLGSAELDGMRRFFAWATEDGWIAAAPQLQMALTRWTACHERAAHGEAPENVNNEVGRA